MKYTTSTGAELELTSIQIEALIEEVNKYDRDGIIFLYEIVLDNYKVGSTMWNMNMAKINFLKSLAA